MVKNFTKFPLMKSFQNKSPEVWKKEKIWTRKRGGGRWRAAGSSLITWMIFPHVANVDTSRQSWESFRSRTLLMSLWPDHLLISGPVPFARRKSCLLFGTFGSVVPNSNWISQSSVLVWHVLCPSRLEWQACLFVCGRVGLLFVCLMGSWGLWFLCSFSWDVSPVLTETWSWLEEARPGQSPGSVLGEKRSVWRASGFYLFLHLHVSHPESVFWWSPTFVREPPFSSITFTPTCPGNSESQEKNPSAPPVSGVSGRTGPTGFCSDKAKNRDSEDGHTPRPI